MFKKIFAIIPVKDFFDFRRRAYLEGMKMGDALAAIVHAYARGARIDLRKFKIEEHHEPTGVKYGG